MFNTNFKDEKQYDFTIGEFRGVDRTNSPLFIEKFRSSEMSNMIMDNGVIQKRFGWKEQHQFNGKVINGVWQFDTSKYVNTTYEIKRHIVVMVDKEFYLLSSLFSDDKIESVKIPMVGVDTNKITNGVAYAIIGGEKLYILCGDFLTIGYYNDNLEVHRVEDDEHTYIPTTTIGIACIGNHNLVRTSYDDFNMMTRWRINTLIGEDAESELVGPYKYILDGECTNVSTVEVLVNGEPINTQFTISNITYEGVKVAQLTIWDKYIPIIEGQDNISVKFECYTPGWADQINNCKFGMLYGYNNVLDRLFFSGNTMFPNMIFHSGEGLGTDQQDFTYFSNLNYIKLGNTTNRIKGMHILGDGTLAVLKTPSGQEPTIYFINAIMITATDREGNTIYVDNEAQIEEAYQTKVGTIGEGLINTSSLQTLAGDTLMLSNNGVFGIVLGENVANSQRYAKPRSRLVNGEITKMDLENAVCIVHENKYYICIDNKCYIADGRYPVKLKDDLSDTFQYEWYIWDNIPARLFFTYNNQLFFGTNDGHIMLFENKNYQDTSYSIMERGELIYDDANKVFVISEDRVRDIEKLHDDDIMKINLKTTDGIMAQHIYALLINKEDIKVLDNNDIEIKKEIYSNDLRIMTAYDFYIDNIENNTSGFELNKPYILTIEDENIDRETEEDDNLVLTNPIISLREKIITIEVIDGKEVEIVSTGEKVNVGDGKYRICYILPESNVVMNVQGIIKGADTIVYYKDVQLENNEWVIYNDEGNITNTYSLTDIVFNRFQIRTFSDQKLAHNIVHYNNADYLMLSCSFEFNDRVECYYVTPVFDLGSVINTKNLKKLIITPDTLLNTEVEFGYETKTKREMFIAYTGRAFDFDNLDFDDISFESEGFAKAYVKNCREKNFNFIRFIFRNRSNNNCKISNLTIVYTYGKPSKGVS